MRQREIGNPKCWTELGGDFIPRLLPPAKKDVHDPLNSSNDPCFGSWRLQARPFGVFPSIQLRLEGSGKAFLVPNSERFRPIPPAAGEAPGVSWLERAQGPISERHVSTGGKMEISFKEP